MYKPEHPVFLLEFVFFTTLSVAQFMLRWIIGWLMNSELTGMCKVAIAV
jgi:hypothetical protein